MTDEQHQEWKRDLEELHEIKAENERLKGKITELEQISALACNQGRFVTAKDYVKRLRALKEAE